MVLNAYSVLDGLICLLRLPLSLLVIGLAIGVLRTVRREPFRHSQSRDERRYLMVLVAGVLLGLNIAAWPLFYLLLQSYVPQWPGVMCIYGVTQIGLYSEGASRFLPGLLVTLQAIKPTVVFASGAWFTLYLANRRTPDSSLLPQAAGVLLAFGILSAVDATLEGTYLVIPKTEKHLDAGCCVGVVGAWDQTARMLPGTNRGVWLAASYCAINGVMASGLLAHQHSKSHCLLPWLLLGGAISIPVNLLFLIHVASPAILHLPYHHCAYDLLAKFPETIVGVGLFACGVFAVGWANLLVWLGQHEQTRAYLHRSVERLLYVGSIGYLASMVLFSIELVLL